jgi:hypothetical protein
MTKTFLKKSTKIVCEMSVFPRFCLSRFWGNPKPVFHGLYHVLGRFSARGANQKKVGLVLEASAQAARVPGTAATWVSPTGRGRRGVADERGK